MTCSAYNPSLPWSGRGARLDGAPRRHAPEASGEIHTDMQKGFIRAEVIAYADLVALGGLAEGRSKGKLRWKARNTSFRMEMF